MSLADTLYFQAGFTTTVSGALTLQGGGSAGTRLSLRSTSPGSQWNLNATGSKTLSWLDVRDSNAITAINATGTNSIGAAQNNTGWSGLA